MTSPSDVATPDSDSEFGSYRAESTIFLRGFIGSAVLLLAIRVAEPLFFGQGYFSTLTYHPFWIVVLLAAVQYGLFVGVATVGLATLMMDWPPRPIGIDITAHYVEMTTTPAQWLLVAVLIGVYRQTQIRRDQQVRQDNVRLAQINDTLTTEVYRLDAALARAELTAATRPEEMSAAAAACPLAALNALADLSGSGNDMPAAFMAAARACSNAQIAWVEQSVTGELVVVADTHPETDFPRFESLWNDALHPVRSNVFSPGEGLAPSDRHAICLPLMLGNAPDTRGAIVGFTDSPDDLPGLTSAITLLARSLEAAALHLEDAPQDLRVDSIPAAEKRGQAHG